MNANMLGQLADSRIDDLRRSADLRTRAGHVSPAAGRRVAAIRSRAGWTLVSLGLRLAARSAGA